MINCSSNTLKICKFVESANGFVKPDNDDEFHIAVESCSSKRYYALNSSNCFCIQLEHLCNESYCVYELDNDGEVSYEVDGCSTNEACVDFMDQDYHHINIINHRCSHSGSLHIQKRVFDACGKEVDSDDSFNVRIRGLDYDEFRVLDPSNAYHVVLHDLPFGSYEVSEQKNSDYDTTYYINGVEKKRGIISVDKEENNIEVYNRMNTASHVLRICKWINQDGRLVKPNYDQSFDIVLKDRYAYKEYTLDCSNHFCLVVEGNKHDRFILEELDASDVVYEVDGEEVEVVDVVMNEDHDVRIINLEDSNPDPEPEPEPCPQTILRIQKWMEEDGRLYRPNQDDVFTFRIQGYSSIPFELNDANDFSVVIDDIDTGYYCIYEDMQTGYEVVYDVNGVIQEDGYLFVDTGTTDVSIINQSACPNPDPDENIIHLVKRVNVCNNANEVAIPETGTFEIYVSGPNGIAYYTLSSENNYEAFVEVENGDYTIYEVNPVNAVTYRLDGVDHINMVQLNVQDSSHEVMIINHVNRVNYII
ncbi:MAG: hypothetical protein EOM50_18775 [Erysipelotrichia bacterium]|nr:hypothetical protein [Erysipelotrichia bacterium]